MQAQQPYMEYRLIEYPVKGQFCCISEEFTSNRLEFIPAFDVINSEKKRNDVSYYEHFNLSGIAAGPRPLGK